MPSPVLEVRNLSKLYAYHRRSKTPPVKSSKPDAYRIDAPEAGPTPDTFWALKDVNFSLLPGESLGIVGKNGSGKTTLLKILSHIVLPTRGSVVIRGRRHSLLEVGTGFHPELTGRKNIYLNAAILGFRKREANALEERIIAFSGIGAFIDTPVKFYSAGMYLRLAFSVGIHFEPDLLILDEVMSVGDAVFQKRCQDKIMEIQRSGCALLFVSHDISKVTALCKRAIWLSAGKIVSGGSSREICESYAGQSQPGGPRG